eukprot:CCRYP_017759-RB/>CCRYP_017759-RB protein AED:0.45 eAED:1.00 QI:0/-1/0/1/-1/0/1/0/12
MRSVSTRKAWIF